MISKLPGFYFGIVLLWTYVTAKVDEYCLGKSPELIAKGRVIYIGSYKLCFIQQTNRQWFKQYRNTAKRVVPKKAAERKIKIMC